MATQDERLSQLQAQEAAFNRRVLIVALTGATAGLHLALGTQLFALNGLGYLALLGAHFATPDRESYRAYTRDALFGYTGVTVVGYFALRGTAGFADPTGMASKLIELGLMNVLWADRGSAGILAAQLTPTPHAAQSHEPVPVAAAA
ncbi:MAG: hypothetical protein H6644_21900 [Caldilineaceae bacterium]|nr:hypothetical protein [Caldilineaceae bacterium]